MTTVYFGASYLILSANSPRWRPGTELEGGYKLNKYTSNTSKLSGILEAAERAVQKELGVYHFVSDLHILNTPDNSFLIPQDTGINGHLIELRSRDPDQLPLEETVKKFETALKDGKVHFKRLT